jgi:G3E family GTPase
MSQKIVPVTLLTGYLGAGKTTLLNHVLNSQNGYKVAVIVNDIGELNIDESLIQKGGNISAKDSIVPLSNGCICCTLKGPLIKQISRLCDSGLYDYILVEASGICEPVPISQALVTSGPQNCRLDGVISVIDAARLASEFGCGKKLTNNMTKDGDDISRLIIQQIEFCTTLVINKTDAVTEEQLAAVKAAVRMLQSDANIIETSYGNVDFRDILNTKKFDFENAYKSAGWIKAIAEDARQNNSQHQTETEEYEISSFVYTKNKPFDRKKFNVWIKTIPQNVIRAKGIVWFADDMNRSSVFEQAGTQAMTRDFGRWASKSESMQKIVFIGQHMNRTAVEKSLDECLY